MNSKFTNPEIIGVARQTGAATQPDHLVRLGEVIELMAAGQHGHSGTATIDPGAAGGVVSGLGLSFTPARCFLTVRAPVGSLYRLSAQPVGALTADGFTWETVNGTTDEAGHQLFYLLTP